MASLAQVSKSRIAVNWTIHGGGTDGYYYRKESKGKPVQDDFIRMKDLFDHINQELAKNCNEGRRIKSIKNFRWTSPGASIVSNEDIDDNFRAIFEHPYWYDMYGPRYYTRSGLGKAQCHKPQTVGGETQETETDVMWGPGELLTDLHLALYDHDEYNALSEVEKKKYVSENVFTNELLSTEYASAYTKSVSSDFGLWMMQYTGEEEELPGFEKAFPKGFYKISEEESEGEEESGSEDEESGSESEGEESGSEDEESGSESEGEESGSEDEESESEEESKDSIKKRENDLKKLHDEVFNVGKGKNQDLPSKKMSDVITKIIVEACTKVQDDNEWNKNCQHWEFFPITCSPINGVEGKKTLHKTFPEKNLAKAAAEYLENTIEQETLKEIQILEERFRVHHAQMNNIKSQIDNFKGDRSSVEYKGLEAQQQDIMLQYPLPDNTEIEKKKAKLVKLKEAKDEAEKVGREIKYKRLNSSPVFQFIYMLNIARRCLVFNKGKALREGWVEQQKALPKDDSVEEVNPNEHKAFEQTYDCMDPDERRQMYLDINGFFAKCETKP